MSGTKKIINLFWTGGWDSTFRLIHLVLIYKKVVQPYYIIDSGRNSVLQEIRAMVKIKNALFEKDIKIKSRILPTIFKEIKEINENKTIAQSYTDLHVEESIAIQYEWLARYCHEEGISNMELCNETAIYDADNQTRRLLDKDLDRIATNYGTHYKLNARAREKNIYKIYGNFHFPVFDYTKLDMYKISKKHGFDDVLKHTWFCLMPTSQLKPCGKCKPCRVVYREGLKWRLPITSKIRYFIWPTLRKIAHLLYIKR